MSVLSSEPPAGGTAQHRDTFFLAALLDGVTEYIYFKDRESRFIAVSRSLVRALGCSTAAEVVGRSDFDFFFDTYARTTRADEEAVMRTGEPLVDKLEQEFWPTGRVTWSLTTKLPLRDRHGEIVGTFGLSKDVTDRHQMEADLEKAHRDLVGASRVAGMAEVATGVLHNVGNVLNSLNVSASVITSGLRQSKAESLSRIASLLRENEVNLRAFVSEDARGRRIPEFISSLARHSLEERDRLINELGALQKNIDHIKEIVAMQQAYATMIGVVESLDPVALIEDSVRMNAGALQRHDIRIERDFQKGLRVLAEQAKFLQILVNLIRNAMHACDEGGAEEKCIRLCVHAAPGNRVHLIVQDNGIGIPPENLTRIFQHGFTTRAKGHGFGLHSAANAAREMKGTLTVQSEGHSKGATFVLELPAAGSPATAS